MINTSLYHNRLLKFFLWSVLIIISGCAQKKNIIQLNDSLKAVPKLLYEDSFDTDLNDWKVEQMKGGEVEIKDGKLEINDVAGCTVWFKKELKGPIMIEYDAVIIKNGGPQDRVSDMNCFWMAKDMDNPNDIFADSEKRGGKFSNYDALRLYYMGVGGNDNATTRFRRYVGNGERPLLPEHDFEDLKYMLSPNQVYQIKIIANNNIIRYYRNDVLMVDFFDEDPYTSGFFGFRTVNNHMTIDNFKVFQLIEKK